MSCHRSYLPCDIVLQVVQLFNSIDADLRLGNREHFKLASKVLDVVL